MVGEEVVDGDYVEGLLHRRKRPRVGARGRRPLPDIHRSEVAFQYAAVE